MNLPARTSKLLALQQAAEAELNARFSKIFKKHRRLAFVHRQDHLFTEHWTPEVAAAGYEFSGYETRDGNIVLYGMEKSNGFSYRISISFPQDLADQPAAVDTYLKRQYAAARDSVRDEADAPAAQESAGAEADR